MTPDRSKITILPTGATSPAGTGEDTSRLFGRRAELATQLPLPYQAAISRVAHAVVADTGFDDLLNEIVLSAIRALDAEIGLIRGISDDGANFVVLNAFGPAPLSIGGMIGSYSIVTEQVRDCDPGESIAIDLRSDSQASALPSNERWDLDHIGGRFLLIVPLYSGGQLVGRLDLVRTSSAPFSVETRSQALPFAAYAANALLDRQLRRASDERQVYQTVVRLHESVEQLADPETILQAVVELIIREPGCARCYAMLWHPDRGEFVPTAVAGLEPHLVDILKLIALSPQVVPAFDQMVHSSRPLVIADATRSTLLPASLVRALGIRAAMIVPLRGRRHQTIGVLLLDQDTEGIQFSERQVSMMAGMAQHLSTVIENAILFEEVRTSSDSMAIINEIAIQLAMLTDEESLFRHLYYQVASVLDASRFALGLIAPDQHAIDARVAVDGEILDGPVRMPIGDDPLSVVITNGRVELAGIRSGDDGTVWLPGGEPEDRSHSHLTVPITVGRNVVGAVTVQSTFRNAYGPREKELLGAIALHTGIAIENARLYRLVQSRGNRRAVVLDEVIHRQEIERKELVDDIHDDTLQTLAACLFRLDQTRTAVQSGGDNEPALDQINQIRHELANNMDRLRRRIFDLRPSTLDRLGLEPALRELLGRIRREHDVETNLEVSLSGRLAADDETLVYRIIQEAVDYISNRDGIGELSVDIRETGTQVLVKIVDDADHDPRRSSGSQSDDADISLLALMERADLAGGRLRIARRAGRGSVMQITLPGRDRERSEASKSEARHFIGLAEGEYGAGR